MSERIWMKVRLTYDPMTRRLAPWKAEADYKGNLIWAFAKTRWGALRSIRRSAEKVEKRTVETVDVRVRED